MKRARWMLAVVLLLSVAASSSAADALPAAAAPEGESRQMKPGDTLELGGRRVTVREFDTLPYVDNEHTRRFVWDTFENPKLTELRTEYELDKVIEPGRTEFEQQRLLMAWVHECWKSGDPRGLGGLRNGLEILRLARKEQKFFCVQYAATLLSAAASVGFVCRPCGHSTHSWTEMWSNEHRKWVFFDPTPGIHVEKDGVPLSTYEVRKETYENDAKDLHVIDARTGRDLGPRAFRYRWFSVIPNCNFLDERPRYGSALRIIDQWTGGDGRGVANPAVDPYFPIHQASLSLVPTGEDLAVSMRTLTPNFKTFQVRVDGGDWRDSPASFRWPLHEGTNRLEARSVNKWDRAGSVSAAELTVFDTAPAQASPDEAIEIPAVAFAREGGGRVAIREKGSQVVAPHVHFWSTPGHWLEWTVDGAEPGEYEMALRYGSRFRTRRKVELNGSAPKGLESVALESTGGWTAWRDLALPARLTLKAGRNRLRITCLDETSLSLAGITLTGPGGREIAVDATGFSAQGGGEVQAATSDEAGYFYSWDNAGHAFEWTLDAAAAGRYDVFLRYAALVPTEREMSVNGRVVEGLEKFPLASTRGWRHWVEARLPAQVELAQGRNVIRMTNTTGKACNLSAIRLVGPGGKERLIPAVAYTKQEGGKVREVRRARHGSFYAWNDAGHWLQWEFDVAGAGAYDVTLSYATKVRSPREVRVNGAAVKGLEELTLEPTGDWQNWREIRLPVRVELTKGRNTLRMNSLGGAGLNLAKICLTPAAAN